MGLLTLTERRTLIEQLLKLPNISDATVRRQLLRSQPPAIRNNIAFFNTPVADLNAIVNATEADSARQADGNWPIMLVIEDALAIAVDRTLVSELHQMRETLQERITQPVTAAPPSVAPRPNNLPTLALALERSSDQSSPDEVIFKLLLGDMEVADVRVPAADLNLPTNLRALSEYQYHDPPYTIPPIVIDRIKASLPQILLPNAPLWLLYETAGSFLPLVPWEALLQPLLGVPLLRIPHFLINPLADPNALDVAICASAPVSEPSFALDELLVQISIGLLRIARRRVQVDLFVDAQVYDNLKARVAAAGIDDRVTVHDPTHVRPSRPRSSTSQPPAGMPWLEWISGALAGRSIDLAYFVGHGCLADDNGLLMMAESPTRNKNREIFIGAQRLDTFLTAIGAWSVGLSAPPQNYSGSGLRLLASQLAKTRPGPLLLHDFADDPTCQQLGMAFEFLFAGSGVAPATPAISLYCHPDYLNAEISSSYGIESTVSKLDQLTLAHSDESRRLLQSKADTPGWLAKSQRVLEKSAAELERTEAFESTPSATRAGSERALTFAADVLARHATAAPSKASEQTNDEEPAQ